MFDTRVVSVNFAQYSRRTTVFTELFEEGLTQMSLVTGLMLVGGLATLLVGAELLVRGASAMATRFGVPALVIGLTVVAFGTSAPELAVSFKGAFSGQTDVALGNVIGSNIFNTFTILGISALIAPLVVAQELVRREVPLMILASLAVLAMGYGGDIGRLDGGLLFVAFVGYTAFLLRQSRKGESPEVVEEYDAEFGEEARKTGLPVAILFVVLGLVGLVVGAGWFVDGAVAVARAFDVSERVIGLTVVAAGTSLPELLTSIVAAYRGERDIAVGNVVGSNLFNILAILGLTAAISPTPLPVGSGVMALDLPVMIAASIACLPIFLSGHRIDRWEGAILLGYYIAYTTYLVLSATGHEMREEFAGVLYFVIPLSALTLLVILQRSWGKPVEANAE